jgi:hypothetical protein
MIQFRQIDELVLEGVYDRGVPNRERIVLRPTQRIRLAEYIVTLALKLPGGLVRPITDNMFWFTEEISIEPPYWVFLYTGPGETRFTTLLNTKEPALVVHWGRQATVLSSESIDPVIFHLEGMLAPSAPSWEDLSQQLNALMKNPPAESNTANLFSKVLHEALEEKQKK